LQKLKKLDQVKKMSSKKIKGLENKKMTLSIALNNKNLNNFRSGRKRTPNYRKNTKMPKEKTIKTCLFYKNSSLNGL
jgi:hypothetical protein